MPAATATTLTDARSSGEVLARWLYQLSSHCQREPVSARARAREHLRVVEPRNKTARWRSGAL